MKTVGKVLTYHGKRLGTKLFGNGKSLGSKLKSNLNDNKRHYLEEEDKDFREMKGDMEKSHKHVSRGNIHHIPKDGQLFMTHKLKHNDRLPHQRKKNH